MKRLTLVSFVFLLLFVVRVDGQFTYNVTDLGTLGGGSSRAYALNASGQVVGWANINSGEQRAFLYANGVMNSLGNIDSGSYSGAYAINNNGQIVGYAQNSLGGNYAFLYSNSELKNVSPFPGSPSGAWGINSSSQIVGDYNGHAFFISSSTEIQHLGTFGGSISYALGINDNGSFVGGAFTSQNKEHAFLYSGGSMYDLGTLTVGGESRARAINLNGDIVGQSDSRAFLYKNNSMIDIGSGSAEAINIYGDIVGVNGNSHAFIYKDGLISDLNTLINPLSGWTLKEAFAINDSGQIAGYGLNSLGQEHAFLLTPIGVPEPSIVFSTIGLSIFALYRTLRKSA